MPKTLIHAKSEATIELFEKTIGHILVHDVRKESEHMDKTVSPEARCYGDIPPTSEFYEEVISSHSLSVSEGFDARERPSDSEPSVVRSKAGRQRREPTMGRFPFRACVNKYLESMDGRYADSTMEEAKKEYCQMEKNFSEIVEDGKMQTMNPKKFIEEDVLAYVGLLRKRGLKDSTIYRYTSMLNDLLVFFGNGSVSTCRRKYGHVMPRRNPSRIETLDEEDFRKVIGAANEADESDWTCIRAYALVVVSLCTGARPGEIRKCLVSDLDTKKWELHLENVKGKGRYGEPRDPLIRQEGHAFIKRYLRVRNAKVAKDRPGNEALFPAMRDKDGFLAGNGLRKAKRIVEAETGVKFDFRKGRRTFGQLWLDDGLTLDDVSAMMGNRKQTLETYYCRPRIEVANRKARDLQTRRASAEMSNSPNLNFWPGYLGIGMERTRRDSNPRLAA